MEVNITDDKRRPLVVAVKDTGVGTYHAEYTADKPGMIFIRYRILFIRLCWKDNVTA